MGLGRFSYDRIMTYVFYFVLFFCVTLPAWAQPNSADTDPAPQGSEAPFEAGFHLGNLLPNQIDGLTEIIGLGGVRAGVRLAPLTYAEAGLTMGNGEGAEWKNAQIDLRMDIPVENLVGIAYIGADMIYFKGAGHSEKLIFGGHAGGGIQMPLTGIGWFRSEMKFGFSPGTSLYIGFGFVFRIGGGAA